MSIPAHTNAVGGHTRYKSLISKVDRIVGMGQNRPREVFDRNLGNVAEAFSFKPPIFRWDGRQATDYFRQVQIVAEDIPFQKKNYRQQFGMDPPYVEVDEIFTDFISRLHGPFGYDPCLKPGVYANCVDEANTEALNDLQKDAAMAAVSVAEGRKTADMLASSATALARALKAAKSGNWDKVASALDLSRSGILSGKYPANKWLEYQYGWKPLKADVHALTAQAIKTVTTEMFVKGRGNGTWTEDINFPYGDLDVRGTASWSCKSVLTGKVTSPVLYRLQGMGLINPAIIAWELMPFSFVLDWFIPVGSVLNALTATAGLTPWGGFTTCQGKYDLHITHSNRSDSSGPGYSYTTPNKGSYKERGFQFRRVTYPSSWPIPDFYVDFTPFSTERVASAASLVRSLRG